MNVYKKTILTLLIFAVYMISLTINGLVYAEKNITISIDKGEFWFCSIRKDMVQCNYVEVDNDQFRMMSNFLEYLNSGMVKENKK